MAEDQNQRYLLTYKEGISTDSALKTLGESPLYLLSPMSRTIGAQIPSGLLRVIEESKLFESIKPDPVKKT